MFIFYICYWSYFLVKEGEFSLSVRIFEKLLLHTTFVNVLDIGKTSLQSKHFMVLPVPPLMITSKSQTQSDDVVGGFI